MFAGWIAGAATALFAVFFMLTFSDALKERRREQTKDEWKVM